MSKKKKKWPFSDETNAQIEKSLKMGEDLKATIERIGKPSCTKEMMALFMGRRFEFKGWALLKDGELVMEKANFEGLRVVHADIQRIL